MAPRKETLNWWADPYPLPEALTSDEEEFLASRTGQQVLAAPRGSEEAVPNGALTTRELRAAIRLVRRGKLTMSFSGPSL